MPLDEPAARLARQIRAELAASGTPIGPYDLQIVAITLTNDLVLVTHNTSEFNRVGTIAFRSIRWKNWSVGQMS